MLKGCCCFDLKTGALYAVFFNLISYVIETISEALKANNDEENYLKVVIVTTVIGWAVNFVLLAGIAKVSSAFF